jgi:hypothetical protein
MVSGELVYLGGRRCGREQGQRYGNILLRCGGNGRAIGNFTGGLLLFEMESQDLFDFAHNISLAIFISWKISGW